jgi:hypothetical protein
MASVHAVLIRQLNDRCVGLSDTSSNPWSISLVRVDMSDVVLLIDV